MNSREQQMILKSESEELIYLFEGDAYVYMCVFTCDYWKFIKREALRSH